MTITRKNKLTATIKSFPARDTKVGDSISGRIGEIKKIVTANYPDGLETIELTDSKGVVSTYWLTGGLRGALKMAKVSPQMVVEIVFEGKESFGENESGQPQLVNTYTVYEAEF